MILSQALSSGNVTLAILLAISYMYTFIGFNRQAVQMIFGRQNLGLEGDDAPSPPQSVQREDWISVAIPFVNLIVSLVIGIYMIPQILQAAEGFGF